MAMKKSIGRSLVHIDVAANTSVRIHEDFFNSHPCSQHLSADATNIASLQFKIGILDPHELAWRFANLLNPIVLAVLHPPNPYSPRLTLYSPNQKAT